MDKTFVIPGVFMSTVSLILCYTITAILFFHRIISSDFPLLDQIGM